MTLTRITPSDENGKREIYFDDEPFGSLSADLIMEFDLHIGQQYDEADIEALLCKIETKRAVQKAYTYLSYQSMSRKKLTDKLLKADFSADAVEAAADKLTELGLINDTAYAERLLDVARNVKHWGSARVRQEMFARGIPSEVIEEMLSDGYDDRPNALYQLAHKYRKRDMTDAAERRKITAGLVRLGFSFDDIRAAIGEFEETV